MGVTTGIGSIIAYFNYKSNYSGMLSTVIARPGGTETIAVSDLFVWLWGQVKTTSM